MDHFFVTGRQFASEPVLIATVNIPTEELKDDEVIIKNYSENEGVLDVLVRAGVVSEPIRTIETGHVTVPVVKLLIKPVYESVVMNESPLLLLQPVRSEKQII